MLAKISRRCSFLCVWVRSGVLVDAGTLSVMPTSELIWEFACEQALEDVLQSMQDPLTQQGKCCPTIHHALDEFELIHMTLNQSV